MARSIEGQEEGGEGKNAPQLHISHWTIEKGIWMSPKSSVKLFSKFV